VVIILCIVWRVCDSDAAFSGNAAAVSRRGLASEVRSALGTRWSGDLRFPSWRINASIAPH